MYLKSLRLENIACFEELDLDFTDENKEPCKWVVLLGENGTGKSTSLLHIVKACHWDQSRNLLRKKFSDYDDDKDRGAVLLDIELCDSEEEEYIKEFSNDEEAGGIRLEYTVFIDDSGNSRFELDTGDAVASMAQEAIFINGSKGWFICGYKPINNTVNKRRFSQYVKNYDKSDRVASILGDSNALTDVKQWLSDLDFRRLKENDKQKQDKYERDFKNAIKAIEGILPRGIEFIDITPEKEIVFRENEINIFFDEMSDGYQASIKWICDLVRRLCDAFPNMENPLNANGVVLVDEIDLHLHPRWQRSIVQQIRNTFPNLQFIVTSHSPFIAQDMTEKDKIIVLTREGDKVTAREEKGFVQNWRAGQILTSWLFGLPTDYDEKIEEKLGKQQELADRKAQGLLTDEEREELRQVTEFLSTLPSEETGAELLSQEHLDREAVRKAAATALRLLRKVEGK